MTAGHTTPPFGATTPTRNDQPNTAPATEPGPHPAPEPTPTAPDHRTRPRTFWRTAATALVAAAGTVVAVLADPWIAGAALVTGVLNTAGGGGAVVTFLALHTAGVPALTAHATSQVITPASFLVGLRTARTHRPDPRWMIAGTTGAICGVAILAVTPPATFHTIAPWCLLPAAALVIAQEPIRNTVRNAGRRIGPGTTVAGVFTCGVYAGMIGVGTGTLAVAVLGLVPGLIHTPLGTLLRTRNTLLLLMAIVVAATFATTNLADWRLAALLATPAAVGGWLGTTIIGRLPHWFLRAIIVATALAGTAWMFARP